MGVCTVYMDVTFKKNPLISHLLVPGVCNFNILLQEFVHRSSASGLASVTAVAWIYDNILAVGFETGLVEIVDFDERRSVHSFVSENSAVVGITTFGASKVFIQSKARSLVMYTFSGDFREWTVLWSIAAPSAVTFARPIVVAGNYLVAVTAGQSGISFICPLTGIPILDKVDLAKSGDAKGMVVSMCEHKDRALILMESGHVLSIHPPEATVSDYAHIAFPQGSESSYILPTCMSSIHGEVLVGFSDGSIHTVHSPKKVSLATGIGALVSMGDNVIVGTWKGGLGLLDVAAWKFEYFRSPHASSITCVCCSAGDCGVVAVGSTDGRVSFWTKS